MATKTRNNAAGLLLGTNKDEKVGLHGAAPTARRDSAAQAAVTATGATVATADGSDAATTQALANALKVQGNANQVDIAALIVLVNELRAALVAKGIIKGAA